MATFTCIDCNTYFSNNNDAFAHNQCITEAQKWHGKFAQQPKNQNQNQSQNQNKNQTPKKEETNVDQSKEVKQDSEKAEKKNENKRKREDESSPDESAVKKQKTENGGKKNDEEESEEIVEDLKFADFKWRKHTLRVLKSANGKSLPVEELQKQVVDKFIEKARSSAEAYYANQLESMKKVTVKKGVAKLGE